MDQLFDGLKAIINITHPQSQHFFFARLTLEKKRILRAFEQWATVPARSRDHDFCELVYLHYTMLMDYHDDLVLIEQPYFIYLSDTIGELRTFLLIHFDGILSNHISGGQEPLALNEKKRPFARLLKLIPILQLINR